MVGKDVGVEKKLAIFSYVYWMALWKLNNGGTPWSRGFPFMAWCRSPFGSDGSYSGGGFSDQLCLWQSLPSDEWNPDGWSWHWIVPLLSSGMFSSGKALFLAGEWSSLPENSRLGCLLRCWRGFMFGTLLNWLHDYGFLPADTFRPVENELRKRKERAWNLSRDLNENGLPIDFLQSKHVRRYGARQFRNWDAYPAMATGKKNEVRSRFRGGRSDAVQTADAPPLLLRQL